MFLKNPVDLADRETLNFRGTLIKESWEGRGEEIRNIYV